jgi:branched-chain amino acid transport system substrate-binding protein
MTLTIVTKSKGGKMKKILVVLLVIGLLVVIVGCAPKAAPPVEKPPVKIGTVMYMSAEMASYTEIFKQGVDLAVKQINDKGGILGGRMIEPLWYEEGFSAEQAVTSVKKATADGCVGISGFVDATTASAVIDILKNAGMPWIAAGPGYSQLVDKSYWGWATVGSPGKATVLSLARFLEDKGFKRVAYIGFDSKWCIDFEEWFSEYCSRPGSSMKLLKSIFVPYTASQIKAETTQAVGLDPDFVIFMLWGDAPLKSGVDTLRALGSKASWTTVNDSVDERLVGVLGANNVNGSWHQFFWMHDPSVAANDQFYKAYQEMYPGKAFNAYVLKYYYATTVMALSFDKAGTTSDIKKFGDAMHALDWITPHGSRLEVLSNGVIYNPTWTVAQYQDGKWVNRVNQPILREDYK